MSDSQQTLQPSPHSEQSARKSSWKQVYLTLCHEKDVKRLTQAVIAVEAAICLRTQELNGSSNHSDERAEIRAAMDELLVIKTQKLGWPTSRSMICDECVRLHAETSSWWKAYLAEKHQNRMQLSRRSLGDSKQEELLRLYKLTAARERVHRATEHPEEGHVVRFQDLQLVSDSE
jgi:hypothetical protein